MPVDKDFNQVESNSVKTGGPTETSITTTIVNSLVDGEPLADDGETYSTVQGAENAASSWVFVPPGTFNETIVADTASLTMVGSGRSTLVDGQNNGIAVTLENSDISIKNMSLATDSDGDNTSGFQVVETNAGADSSLLSGVHCPTAGAGLIFATDGTDHSVIDCVVDKHDATGINFNQARTLVSNCLVESTDGTNGISVQDDSIISSCIQRNAESRGIWPAGNDAICLSCRTFGSDIGLRADNTNNILANNRVSAVTTNINDNGTGTILDGNLTG